jgi:hypothetical protein
MTGGTNNMFAPSVEFNAGVTMRTRFGGMSIAMNRTNDVPTGTVESVGGRRREEGFALGAWHERGIMLHLQTSLILDPWLASTRLKLM